MERRIRSWPSVSKFDLRKDWQWGQITSNFSIQVYLPKDNHHPVFSQDYTNVIYFDKQQLEVPKNAVVFLLYMRPSVKPDICMTIISSVFVCHLRYALWYRIFRFRKRSRSHCKTASGLVSYCPCSTKNDILTEWQLRVILPSLIKMKCYKAEFWVNIAQKKRKRSCHTASGLLGICHTLRLNLGCTAFACFCWI